MSESTCLTCGRKIVQREDGFSGELLWFHDLGEGAYIRWQRVCGFAAPTRVLSPAAGDN